MTRAVILCALAGLCCLALAAPADAAGRQAYGFAVTAASMTEVMSFHGDGPSCARAGVCGYSGTVTYHFDHANGLAAFAVQRRRVHGAAAFFYSGLTSATVQGPGGGAPCTDKVLHDFDGFEVEGTTARMRVLFHPPADGPSFLDTYCAGPSDLQMAHAHALPTLTLPASALRRRTIGLHTSRTVPFQSGPFEGTLAFSADVEMRRSRQLTAILEFRSPRA